MSHLNLLVFNWQDRLHPLAGGAETHLHAIFGRLAARGHEVTLITSGFEGSAPREVVDDIDVHRVGNRLSYPFAAAARYRHLAHAKFDVVVEDLNKLPLATPLWVKEPVLLLVHHLFGSTAFAAASAPIAAVTMLAEVAMLPLYSKCPIVAVSDSSASEARRRTRHPEPVRVIHNGVEIPEELVPRVTPDMDDMPTFVCLGRLQQYKRVDLPIRAVAALARAGRRVRLVVAGEGPESVRLHALASQLGVEDRVEFHGYVKEHEKEALMARAVANVTTSVKEGWGISILEAATERTPTIASDSPGLRDAVRDGVTGLLVPHDDVAALAAAMARLIDNRQLRDTLGNAARSVALEHTWDAAAEAFEGVLVDAVRSSRGRVPTEGSRLQPSPASRK